MTDMRTQVSALIKKEYLLLTRTKNYLFQELFGPLFALLFAWYGTTDIAKQAKFPYGLMAIPLFLSRTMFGLTYNIVHEKSQNFKEYLRVNGASLHSYMLAMFIFYLIRSVIAVLILFVGLFFILDPAQLPNPIEAFFSLLIYAVALLNFTLMLTTFFSSPRLATEINSLIVTLVTFVFYAVVNVSSQGVYYLACLLPPVACVFSVPTFGGDVRNAAGFQPYQGMLMQIANCFLYFLLYGYFDSVIPSDNGIKDPLFSCPKRSRRTNSLQELNSIDQDPISHQRLLDGEIEQSQDVSSAQHHEPFHNPLGLKRTVFVDQLTKIFGENIAVDGITMPMFERQIFCLLGHNGAGKTTTINMMTGLLRAEQGKIFYGKNDFADDFESLRRNFGLCVQKDILYDNLTAAEHIELISRLRGVPLHEIPQYTNLLAQKVGIQSELTKLASTLSGGNKRKLSLGLAIAGQVQVVFLDEPTSGMDPNARRNFWDIVRSLRDEGKTILLTTHSLDEADELADRIAVMSKGKLLILGTSNYLKKKYGVGYNLIITPKPGVSQQFLPEKDRLINQVKAIINTSEVDTKTAPEMIKMILPYSESNKFNKLFSVLENEPLIEIALELNTLEDVFVNIGLQEEMNEAAQAGAYTINTNENIPMPESINQPSSYHFSKQVSAMFIRKLYCTIRNRTTMLQILFPLLYVILCNVLSTQVPGDMAQMITFVMGSMVGFLINTNVYVAFPVIERENNIKYLLRTIGIRPLSYWLGTMAFDTLVISIFAILLVPVGYFLKISMVANNAGYFALVMVSFGFSLVSQSYILSWIYDKQATVYKFNILLTLFGTFYLPLLVFGLILGFNVYDNDVTVKVLIILGLSILISPPILLMAACITLTGGASPDLSPLLYFLLTKTSLYIGLLLAQAFLFFAINFVLEKRSLKLKIQIPKELKPHTAPDFIPNPEEIAQEEQRVRHSQNEDLTKTIELGKVYANGFQALREISFGVEKRQIFGLLGPNGAGKSTTFNILTGLITRSSGQVFFNGQTLEALTPEIFQNTGICPQFNALWDDLSLVEHLEIVGKVKGLDEFSIHDAIAYYSKILRMEEHLDKKANQLSGGTKRKLCVANMLIAAPTVQFLDEPSTGLDPLSKRALYDTITQNLQDRNASIILTTHSMSEAESLCSKIGILINGKFVCIGSLPYLKSRYGSGYKIAVVKQDSNSQVYEKVILDTFPTAVKENDNSDVFVNYRVPMGDFSFSKAFDVMENLKTQKEVSDFNIINTTLEQVFIQFSKNQIAPPPLTATTSSS